MRACKVCISECTLRAISWPFGAIYMHFFRPAKYLSQTLRTKVSLVLGCRPKDSAIISFPRVHQFPPPRKEHAWYTPPLPLFLLFLPVTVRWARFQCNGVHIYSRNHNHRSCTTSCADGRIYNVCPRPRDGLTFSPHDGYFARECGLAYRW